MKPNQEILDVGVSICFQLRIRQALFLLAAFCLLLLQLYPGILVPVKQCSSTSSELGIDGGVKRTNPITDDLDEKDPGGPLFYAALHEVVNTTSFNLSRGDVRIMQPHGLASHFFIQFGSYRLGARHFAVVGLIAQHLEQLQGRAFECEWHSRKAENVDVEELNGLPKKPENAENATAMPIIKGKVWKIRPDFGYHRLYGTLVLSCTFDEDVGVDREGGEFWITASYGDSVRPDLKFVALREAPGDYNASAFQPPFPYEYVYCGSPLYGSVSPQRTREWMTYHNHFFGDKAFFVLYDGGGIHDEVYEVLKPWMERGKLSIQNVREADIYDGYYHHQFAIVNDCMFRAQAMANWTFFFDLDEYMYVNESVTSLARMLEESEHDKATQIQLEPIKLDNGLCLHDSSVVNGTRDAANAKKWLMEKLVFAWKWRWPIMRNRKYAIKSRECWATGVHKCELLKDGGHTRVMNETDFRFYHYHNTLSTRDELCKQFVPEHLEPNYFAMGEDNYTTDNTMVGMADMARQYERETIGEQPFVL